jgi:Protein of unknown function (DUF2845)
MTKWLMLAVVACLPALVTAQSLRCDGKIISEGASRAEVAALCGDPVQVDQKSVYYRPIASTGNQANPRAASAVEVQVEVWTYNFGPNRLMQRIRFEDGLVVRIESLGYGY